MLSLSFRVSMEGRNWLSAFGEQVINFHLLAVNGGAAVIDYHLVHLLVDVVQLFNKYK
jgi:hypothetical protein